MIHYRQHVITSAISLYFLEICTQCRRKLEEASLIESPTPESTNAPIAEHRDQDIEEEISEDITQVNNTLLLWMVPAATANEIMLFKSIKFGF